MYLYVNNIIIVNSSVFVSIDTKSVLLPFILHICNKLKYFYCKMRHLTHRLFQTYFPSLALNEVIYQ